MVDNNQGWRNVISDYLKNNNEIALVGACESTEEAFEIIENNIIDIILLDTDVNKLIYEEFDTTLYLKKATDADIIMLTISENRDIVEKAILAGAVDYVLKSEFKETLVPTIKRVYFNSCSKIIAEIIRKKEIELKLSGLSKSEREIIDKCCNDKTPIEIQSELHYQKQSYWNCVNKIKKKLNFDSLKEAVDYIKAHS
jgi:DNA-binding NarL/FixJ family response regulator